MNNSYEIINQKTEFQVNPININTQKPRFSWGFKAYDGFKQKSFKLNVSSSKEKIQSGDFDLWCSGWVESNKNFGIEYAGKKLNSAQLAFWQVEVKDDFGNVVKSQTATFKIALLGEKDWKGKWISMPGKYSGGALYFRHEFILPDKPVKCATAYICGIGYNEFYINGKKKSDNILEPAVTDYSKRVLYSVYDITENLNRTENCIGFITGHGWFGDRKLLVQIYIDFTDGQTMEIHTDHGGWFVGYGPIIKDSIYDGEEYDARLEEQFLGWNKFGFNSFFANGWLFAMRVPPPGGVLQPQTVEPIKVQSETECFPVFCSEKRIIFDTRQNMAGVCKITVRGEIGAKVTLRFAEQLSSDKTSLNRLNLRSAEATDVYILKSGEEETYCPRFTYHGFQYVEVTIDGSANLIDIKAVSVRSSVRSIGKFRCSDEKLNKLHEISVNTESANLFGIMTDCPQRDERFGWLNDLSTRIYQVVCNYNMSRFFPKIINDIVDTQDENGCISDTAPSSIGCTIADPVSISFLLLAEESYKNYGDVRVIEENYVYFKKWTDYLISISDNYILNFGYYGDWVSPEFQEDHYPYSSVTTKEFVSSAYLFWYTEIMARFADIVGNRADLSHYVEISEKIKAAFNRKYYRNGVYGTNSQACNSIALSLGLCDESERCALAKSIADNIVDYGYINTTGNQGYRHMFYSLSEEGFSDVIYKMLTNEKYPGWGYMLACGATTVWERWEARMEKDMNSFNHPMFGSYDGWFYNRLVGINVADGACGANRFDIKPCLISDIEFAEGEIETINGKVISAWHKTDGGIIKYSVTIPPNTSAKIRISGNIISASGRFVLTKLQDLNIIDVDSGSFEFTVKNCKIYNEGESEN